MGEKGSLKNKLKDFFKIQKKLKQKKKLEQEVKQIKEIEKRKKRKTKLLIIIGYLGNLITFPLTQKKKNYKTTNPQKSNSIYNKNGNEKFQKTNSNYNKINPLKPEKINILKENKEIKQKQTNFIIKLNNTSLEKIKKNINCNSYLNQQSINKQPTLKKSQTKQNNSMNQKLINSKEKEKNKYVANAIVAGALASHFVGKVSKEILNATSSIFTDIPKDDTIDQQQEYSNLKKEKNMIDNSFPNNFIESIDNNLKKDRPIYPEIGTINDNVKTPIKNNIQSIEYLNQTVNTTLEKNKNIKKINQNNQPQGSIKEEIKIEENKISKEDINVKENTTSKEKISHDKVNELEKEQLNENFKLATIDIKNAFQIINNDISKQEMELEQIKHYLQNIDQKEKKLISIVKEKAFALLNPVFSLFQNTIFGKLVHSIIMNHRIKYMRKITNQQYQIKYYNLKNILKNIHSQKEIMINNIKINNNSLEEIESLKFELLKLNTDSLEVLKTLQYLTNLENNIIKQNNKIKSQIEKANELEEKGKVKIKKLKAS